MPFVDYIDPRYTDVVLEELPHNKSREIGNLQRAATVTLEQGTILWRVKSTTANAVWDVVDAVGDIAIANEYAILIGDEFEVTESIPITSGVSRKVIALVRDARIKEFHPERIHTALGLSAGNWDSLKRILADQGLLVEPSLDVLV